MQSIDIAKVEFQKEVQLLHIERSIAFKAKDFTRAKYIGWLIDEKVIRWNEENPKGPTYLDLHGMTWKGAIRYVEETVLGKPGEWFLETGRGNHSPNNVPVIKTKLLEAYGCSIREHDWNKGILILTVLL